MKKLCVFLLTLSSLSIFADINCKTDQGWGLKFQTENEFKFLQVAHILQDNSVSDADTEFLQAYTSDRLFYARVILDGQHLNITAMADFKAGNNVIYNGYLTIDDSKNILVTCSNY